MNASINVGELVEQSTRQYLEIADLLGSLKDHLQDNSPKMITTMLDQFNQMSKEARLLDAQIEDNLRYCQMQFSDDIKEKLLKRKEVQQETLQRIEQTIFKASTIKSYLTSEFLCVRKGRNAISGYKNNSRKHGVIVNKCY